MMSKQEEKRRHSTATQKDNVDATSLLKKLTPKLIKSSVELNAKIYEEAVSVQPGKPADLSVAICSQQASGLAPAPPPAQAVGPSRTSAVETSGEDVPDWYEELSEDHVSAFKEVFDMLDARNTGTLNADSLFEGLKRVDSEITRHEVEEVLKYLDKDGNGEIDFDEFLYHISHSDSLDTQGQEDDESSRKRRCAFTKRQRLFYSAITEFSLKRTLVDIQRAQMARVNQPHVLSHYTAGARLIGLTDRQLANEMKRMQKNMKQQDSPYAKPLQLVVSAGGRKTVRKAIRPRMKAGDRAAQGELQSGASQVTGQVSLVKQISLQVPVAGQSVGRVQVPEINAISETPKLSAWTGLYGKIKTDISQKDDVTKDIWETVRMLASRGSVVAKLPDAHKILELREKLAQDIVAVAEAETETQDESTAAVPPSLPPPPPPPPPPSTQDKPKKPRDKRRRVVVKGWTIPRVDRDKVPLPVLKIKYKHHKPTMEDLPNIREKASQAIDDYYESLRKATVKNAWDHWDKLYSHRIRSHKLMENFREVYCAYSPHKEEEAFVVCPWGPGPFRHIRHGTRCHTAGSYLTHCGSYWTQCGSYWTHCGDRHRQASRYRPARTSHPGNRLSSGRTSQSENRPFSAV